ncbi:MAG: lipopolysaccharide biosynthesis protein [Bacteroidetes bacterium]|nr:MAG: lipopolysaccharide biosynthesis protein [Bacteroidota bacterium]
MSQIKSVIKSSALYTILGFMPAAANFVMVPLLTEYLSTEEYGLLSVSSIFQSFIGVFMILGMDAALSRFYFRYYKKRKLLHALYSTGIIFILLLAVIIFLVLLLFGDFGLQLLFKNDRFHFFDYGLPSFFEAVPTVLYLIMLAYYRNEENVKMYALLSIMSLLAIVSGVLIGVVYLGMGAYGNILGKAVGMCLMTCIYLFFFYWKKPIIFRFKSLKPLLNYGLPFVPYFLLLFANSNLNKWIMEREFSLDELGQYNFAFQLASLCSVFTYAVYNAIGPRVYKLMSEDESGYKNESAIANLLKLFHIIVVFVVVSEIALIAPVTEFIVTNPDYLNILNFVNFLIVMWLVHMYYMLYSIPLMFFNKTKLLPVITLIGFIIGISANFALIPIWGIIGVCASAIIIKFTISIASYWFGKQQKVFHAEYYQLGKNHVLAIIVFASILVSYWLGTQLDKRWFYLINMLPIVVFGIVFLLFFGKDFKTVLNSFRRK